MLPSSGVRLRPESGQSTRSALISLTIHNQYHVTHLTHLGPVKWKLGGYSGDVESVFWRTFQILALHIMLYLSYLFWTWCPQRWRQRKVCSRWRIVSHQGWWRRSPCLVLSQASAITLDTTLHSVCRKETTELWNDDLLIGIQWPDYLTT